MKTKFIIVLLLITLIPTLISIGFLTDFIHNKQIGYWGIAISFGFFLILLSYRYFIEIKIQNEDLAKRTVEIENEKRSLLTEVADLREDLEFNENLLCQHAIKIDELSIGLASKLSRQEKRIALESLAQREGKTNLEEYAVELENNLSITGLRSLLEPA